MAYLRAIGGCITSAQREPVLRKQAIWGKQQQGASAGRVILADVKRGRPEANRSPRLQMRPSGLRGVDQMTFLLSCTPALGSVPELSAFVKTAI